MWKRWRRGGGESVEGTGGDHITLGIETSCDDTSAAVLRNGREILSSVVSSQVALHGPYGGVVPELASRAHLENIRPVVDTALRQAGLERDRIHLLAATRGPGLIGSLLVGLNYAKATAYALNLPIVGVNHLEAHFLSPFLEHPDIEYPLLALIVSGGHTSLYFSGEAWRYECLAGTRDDAAGEAYDKVAKMLGLPYPGGPVIDRLASGYDGACDRFAPPKISDGSLDFSFSGLKTAVLYILQKEAIPPVTDPDAPGERVLALVKGFQEAAVDHLMRRIEAFCRQRRPRSLLLCGGVACNSALRRRSREFAAEEGIRVYVPSPRFTTDNAAMVALAGYRRFQAGHRDSLTLNATASLPLEDSGL
jgi:N6-L-threonylcarbamoyladenine synthase